MTVVLHRTNVNDLYTDGVKLLVEYGKHEKSRAGDVQVMPCPVMSIYEKPMERVLFDQKRDANPFFHLFEGLWMLAGRDDTAPLVHYVKDFARFAEANGIIHGAYGYRWRTEFGFDQLEKLVEYLRADPTDRQCVLQMWDCNVSDDLHKGWKDRPCNTHCYFRVREEQHTRGGDLCIDKVLDMTIMCRSNDIIWGAYGANAVHFSMLLEYMAGRTGCEVGKMYQLSNNFHAYTDILRKVGTPTPIPYAEGMLPVPMGTDWNKWNNDLEIFMEWHDWLWQQDATSDDIDLPTDEIVNIWFCTVAAPMCMINWFYKNNRLDDARQFTVQIEAPDWRAAADLWLNRRRS